MTEFNLTRKEFADKLGITTDNLKKKMKRGHYKNSYLLENGKEETISKVNILI